jgi:hypothetical protein
VGAKIPVEKKFRVLVEICRASHFAWRGAVARFCPDVDPGKVVDEMWAITGEQTGQAYLKHLDPAAGDLAKQVAASIVWSSQCMGEDAQLEEGERPGEYLVRHLACPWRDWHARHGLLDEDRPGCDRWFESTFRIINEKLGSKVRFETRSALPEGDDCCLRRIWVE